MQSGFPHSDPGLIVFLAGWALAMTHLAITKFVIERLKQYHHATWVRLGSPGMFINGNATNAFRLWRFITFREHRALGDDTVDLVCIVNVALQLIILPLFFASIYLLAGHPVARG